MLQLECDLIGLAPIGFSAPISSPKNDEETHDQYEQRTWRERMHVDKDGHVFVPPLALKNGLAAAAKYRPKKVQGQGMKTYTKFLEAGILVVEPLILLTSKGDFIDPENVRGNRLFVPSDGKKGGGSRVWKTFPTFDEWRTHAVIHIIEPLLIGNPPVVQDYIETAGQFIGFCQFRPERGGYFGRYRPENWLFDGKATWKKNGKKS